LCSAHRITVGGKRVLKTTFSASSVAEFEAVGVDVAFAAAFSTSLAGNSSTSEFAGFRLRAQEAAFSQVDTAILEQTEWTVGGLPAVNFYAVHHSLTAYSPAPHRVDSS